MPPATVNTTLAFPPVTGCDVAVPATPVIVKDTVPPSTLVPEAFTIAASVTGCAFGLNTSEATDSSVDVGCTVVSAVAIVVTKSCRPGRKSDGASTGFGLIR